MKLNLIVSYILVLCLSICSTTKLKAQDLKSQIDNLINSQYNESTPGVSVLVAKNGEIMYNNAFGSSNLELQTKSIPSNVYQIGSITKQFTAVSILMLEEQGKLSLEDEITKFIPDYPTQGKIITVHHLLNHTSGIMSYTNMEEFLELAPHDMAPLELIDVFKNEPMEFEPGEAVKYNNSGYILLGYIIEVASGKTYEDFIEQEIFKPLSMTNSSYGRMSEIVPNRPEGYDESSEGYVNADYLSLTLPYAAGSIMSTTEDLLKWQNAMNANQVITRASYDKAIHGSTLNNGEEISYGYGWGTSAIQGSSTIEHSGGIFGFTSNGIFLPEENMYIVGLTNCTCGNVSELTRTIAAMAIGKPYPKSSDAVELNKKQLEKWIGAYQFDEDVVRFVTIEGQQVYSQREGSVKMNIYPLSEDKYFFEGEDTAKEFYKKKGKKMVRMTLSGSEIVGVETDKKAPEAKVELTLSQSELADYNGIYELAPDFKMNVEAREGKIFVQATGQSEIEIFAHEKDKFFLKVIPADITFQRDDSGKIVSLILFQGGQEMKGRKMN